MNNSIIFLGIERNEDSIEYFKKLLDSGFNVIAAISLKNKNTIGYFIKELIVNMIFNKPSLRKIAKKKNINHKRVLNINSSVSINYIRKLNPDLICVCLFGQILKKGLLEIPPYGVINVHPSLLPKYRGADPCFWVIKNAEKETGVTIHYINEGIDTGDIILQESFIIKEGTNIINLKKDLSKIGSNLMVEAINQIFEDRVEKIPQEKGFKVPVQNESDYVVEYNTSVKYIYNFIKGFEPMGLIFRIGRKKFIINDAIKYDICSHDKFSEFEIYKGKLFFYGVDGIIILKLESFKDKLLRIFIRRVFGSNISLIPKYYFSRFS